MPNENATNSADVDVMLRHQYDWYVETINNRRIAEVNRWDADLNGRPYPYPMPMLVKVQPDGLGGLEIVNDKQYEPPAVVQPKVVVGSPVGRQDPYSPWIYYNIEANQQAAGIKNEQDGYVYKDDPRGIFKFHSVQWFGANWQRNWLKVGDK